jgi:hypothetical protein
MSVWAQKQLFNGKNLNNWDIFLGTPIKGHEDLARKATASSTYQVIILDGQPVIRVSGEINASLSTTKIYKNYHLHLEFRWGEHVTGTRNSGLLYHSFGPFGAAFGTWMTNIEHQLMHDNLGDTYLMNNTYCETKAVKRDDGSWAYAKDGELKAFCESENGRSIKKAVDAEKPLGEWNSVDLYCYGPTSLHVVNGVLVMLNTNCSKIENGRLVPLTEGKIQIQSEGAELFIRKIEIEKIREIPSRLIR